MKKHKSEINDRFVEYFRENFFADKPEELGKFLESLTKPLPKTIRVNTARISVEDFKARAIRNNWTLTPTNNPTVFRIDRTEIRMPLGHTLEHLLGYFYIQELSASMSVYYLSANTPHSFPHPPTPSPFGGEGKEISRSEAKSPEYVFALAKELRQNLTNTEEIMWGIFRNRNFFGYKFRRQHPLGRYIADFYSEELRVVIEIDGKVHENISQQEYDIIRDTEIKNRWIQVVRIVTEDILNNLEKTLQYLYHIIITPLSSEGEGLGVRKGSWSENLRMKIWDEPLLILDMAASPGGKTTQLAEHYPTSIIVANEPTRDRMAQLVQNTERLGNDRIMITNYDGGHYNNLPETFDRILLDAPCSGEGIGFKESQTVKYWNLKNIHTIARLQTKLLDAAFRALKTGGEVLYSTCTLNLIENEGVVHEIQSRYPESFEVLFEKRFWPHEEASGGFFVCKIRKNKEISDDIENKKIRPVKINEELIPLTKDHERLLSRFTETVGLDLSKYYLFEFKRDILAIRKNSAAKALLQRVFPIRLGKRIGRIEEGVFTPDNRIGRDFRLTKTSVYEIQSEQELDDYLRGKEIGEGLEEGYYVLRYNELNIGLESVNPKTGHFTNIFPREWQRK